MSSLQALVRGARVDPLRSLPLPTTGPGAAEIVETLGQITGAAANRNKVRAMIAVRMAANALEAVGEAVGTVAGRVRLELGDLLSHAGGAFLDLELQRYLTSWRYRQMKDGALATRMSDWVQATRRSGVPAPPTRTLPALDSPNYPRELLLWGAELQEWAATHGIEDILPGSPLEYAKRQRSGSPHARLQLYLGSVYKRGLPGRTVRGPSNPQSAARWPWFAGRVWPDGGPDAAATMLRALTTPSMLASKIELVLIKTRVGADPRSAQRTADIIDALVRRYSPDGELTEEAVRKLMGRKNLTVEDFIDRVASGLDMMKDEADLLAPDLFEQLLQIPGIESFIEQAVHRSGHQHGYTFEVFLAARELFQRPNLTPADLWMQVFVDGKMGPDMVRVLTESGQRIGRIIQAKSYKSLRALLGAGDNAEIRRQILSDLKRIQADGFRVAGPGGELIPIDRIIEFKIDWYRLRMQSFDIPGVDPSDLRSIDPTRATRARNAFNDRHVRSKVDEINAWLASPEMRADLGLGPNDPPFRLEVELADHIVLPDFTP